jgi:hypothetical protein
MRSILLSIATLCVTVGLFAGAQERKPKAEPTDEALINLVGGRLAKLFSQFGTPDEIFPVRVDENPEMDFVILEYHGAFQFGVRRKTVGVCHFMPGWKGKIRGINLGYSREQVIKTLGDDFENSDDENSDGVYDCKWDLKDNDARLWVIFDRNDKATRVTVELK